MPRTPSDPDQTEESALRGLHGGESLASILVVEDCPASRLAVEAVLEPLGQRLVLVDSAEEALRRLLDEDFAVILLDVTLPGMDGFEAARLIKSRPRSAHTPIVFLTGTAPRSEQVLRGYARGAVDYLLKPVDPDILRSKVSVFVDLHHMRERLQRQEAALRQRELDASQAVLRQLMASSQVGLLVSDDVGRVLEVNAPLLELLGCSREELETCRDLCQALGPPGNALQENSLQGGNTLARERVLQPVERELTRRDGSRVSVLMAHTRLEEHPRTLTFVLDLTGRRRAERRMHLLAEASRALVGARGGSRAGATSRLQQLVRLVVGRLGTACVVDLVEADGALRRVAFAHEDPREERRLRPLLATPPAPGPTSPLREVLRSGRPLLLRELPPEVDARAPDQLARLEALASHSLITVRMRARGRTLGLLSVAACGAAAPLDGEDLALAEELAQRMAATLESALLLGETRRAEQESRFLAEASRLLSALLDEDTILQHVARLAVPMLADWCIADLCEPTSEAPASGAPSSCRLRRVAVVHADRGRVRLLHTLDERSPAVLEGTTEQVIRSGMPELRELSDAALARMAGDRAHLQQLRGLGWRASYTVPLRARGRTLGALTFLLGAREDGGQGRRFRASDLRMAEDLAQRTALCVDNAQLYREAQEAIRARDAFLSVASHELKTPLTPLSLKLHRLVQEVEAEADTPLAGRLLSHLQVARRQLKRLADLVSSLLDVSRIDSGVLRLQPEELDLAELTREVAARFAPQAASAGCTLHVEAPQPVPGSWDPLRLEQVIANLLSNALKYGPGKPVHLRVESGRGGARLTVRDEGIGICPVDLPRIFDRFERAVPERHYGGLGLGLYISRTIVEALGGQLRVESTPGAGSTFTVELPWMSPLLPHGPRAGERETREEGGEHLGLH